jgi:hypothetical protein
VLMHDPVVLDVKRQGCWHMSVSFVRYTAVPFSGAPGRLRPAMKRVRLTAFSSLRSKATRRPFRQTSIRVSVTTPTSHK